MTSMAAARIVAAARSSGSSHRFLSFHPRTPSLSPRGHGAGRFDARQTLWARWASHDAAAAAASKAASPMRMLLVGCPGSGKGTQASRLLKRYDVAVLSAGDILRKNIAEGTDVGKMAAAVINNGNLLPDKIIADIMSVSLREAANQDWLLDGFPRTVGQAVLLDAALAEQGTPLKLVVNLDVPEDVILQRILDRWVDVPSGRVYNLSYNPPKVAGKDDVTGEPLSKRPDDNPDVFKTRLEAFRKDTYPLLEYYSARDLRGSPGTEKVLVSLKGSTSDEIWPQLETLVQERFGLVPRTAV